MSSQTPPPPQGPAFELPPPQSAKPVYKRWWFLTGAGVIGFLVVISALGSIGGTETAGTTADEAAVTISMPDLIGQRLDVAISEMATLDVAERDIEVVGGGTFGAIDDSNWTVCEQRPAPGSALVESVRFIIDRECPEVDVAETTGVESEASLESSAPELEPEVDPEVDPEPVPMSPARFAASARGDLRDMSKDLNDLRRAVDQGGLFRMVGNALELSFNLGQLQSLNPPSAIAAEWETELGVLDERITRVQDAVRDDSSLGTLRKRMTATEQQIKKLRSVINKLNEG